MAVGWGRETWGSGRWGLDFDLIELTGLAATFQVGTVAFRAGTTVDLTGISVASQLGNADLSLRIDISVTGLALAIELGNAFATGGTAIFVTGFDLTTASGLLGTRDFVQLGGMELASQTGEPQFTNSAVIAPDGVTLSGSVADTVFAVGATVPITGINTAFTSGVLDSAGSATIDLPSLEFVAGIGDSDVEMLIRVSLEGITLRTNSGDALVWAPVNDSQTVTWTPVVDS